MFFGPPTTLIARLRTSVRLAVFVLLVFALKIGAVAACAKQDFADLGLDIGTSHGLVIQADAGTDNEPLPASQAHAGSCSHCGCHHASALTRDADVPVSLLGRGTTLYCAGLPPSASPRLELRPPIA